MKNNGVEPTSTSFHHWLELMPGYAYCFVPSLQACAGVFTVYNSKPEFIEDFGYSMKIEEVLIFFYFILTFKLLYQVQMHSYSPPSSEIYDNKAVPTDEKQVRFSLKGTTFINRFQIAEPFL